MFYLYPPYSNKRVRRMIFMSMLNEYRDITKEEKDFLFSITRKDMDFIFFTEMYGTTYSAKEKKLIKPKFRPQDSFTLEPNEYYNKEKIITSVGSFLFNKFLFEEHWLEVFGYQNQEFTGKNVGKLTDLMASLVLKKVIDFEPLKKFLKDFQWLTMKTHALVCTSVTEEMIRPNPKVINYLNVKLEENRDALDKGDAITMVKIEEDVVKFAEDLLKDDPGMQLYRSGARGSFGNNYKNMNIVKGAIANPAKGRFDIVESNLMNGIRKEEIPIYANSVVGGAYPKAIGVTTAGYFSKQITAALQTVVLDEPETDCGTKKSQSVTLTEFNKYFFRFCYSVIDGKKVLLEDEALDKLVGKEIHVRLPNHCKNQKICNVCGGEMYYRLGLRNIGLSASRMASSMLNLQMKKFHDPRITVFNVDPQSIFI